MIEQRPPRPIEARRLNTLVLGGCGFIGSHIVDVLLARRHAVTVFDRRPEEFRPPLPGVRYAFGQFSDRMALIEAMSGADVVFHLISSTWPGTGNFNPREDASGNLVGTLDMLDAMVALKVPRIVFLSSGGTVYGPSGVQAIPESHPLQPICSYGIIKTAIEHYLGLYQAMHGLSPVAIRAANPFGPRQGHVGTQGVISTFLRSVAEGRPIELWGDGSVVRDYLYVRDLAECCVLAAESKLTGALNAGSGRGHSLNEVIAMIERGTHMRLEPMLKPARPVDVPYSVLDCTRAQQELGWHARTGLEEAIALSWQWVKAQCQPPGEPLPRTLGT
ncbi:NAD-dependent epimerase/dehydratase family protein [Xanthobacter sp. TB0136]|uniref:NAD-dependent epimerase/dehydratase family protein n=1 Tax=Xanthobacter sp. TB0136 TaxID=3459177 RepID=UPI004039D54D